MRTCIPSKFLGDFCGFRSGDLTLRSSAIGGSDAGSEGEDIRKEALSFSADASRLGLRLAAH